MHCFTTPCDIEDDKLSVCKYGAAVRADVVREKCRDVLGRRPIDGLPDLVAQIFVKHHLIDSALTDSGVIEQVNRVAKAEPLVGER